MNCDKDDNVDDDVNDDVADVFTKRFGFFYFGPNFQIASLANINFIKLWRNI